MVFYLNLLVGLNYTYVLVCCHVTHMSDMAIGHWNNEYAQSDYSLVDGYEKLSKWISSSLMKQTY